MTERDEPGFETITVLGGNVTSFEEPSNAVRWIMRGGSGIPVLQQCWIASYDDGKTKWRQEQWRDVPTVWE